MALRHGRGLDKIEPMDKSGIGLVASGIFYRKHNDQTL
jgi:hypothetical protein